MSIVTSFYNKCIWLSPYFENIVLAVLYDCWQEDSHFIFRFHSTVIFWKPQDIRNFLLKQHVKTYLQMNYCAISKIGGISLKAKICRVSWHLFSLPPMLAWERVRNLQNLFVKQGISPLFVEDNMTHGRLVILQSIRMMFEFPMKKIK